MAEKPEDQISLDDKIARGKELFALGCRSYYVKSYSEAADDLSEASKLLGEAYGVDGDELGDVYLYYAKALVAIGQEENKVIDVAEEDDEEEEEPVEEDDGDSAEGETKPKANGVQNGVEKTNGHAETPETVAGEAEFAEKPSEAAQSTLEEPQAGPSGNNDNESSNDVPEVEEDEDSGNLEVAWEVLQNAAMIFERREREGLGKLDVYIEMAGISLENGNFELAIKDNQRALDVYEDLHEAEQNKRIAAEINYKVGLCQMASDKYEESVKSFQTAADMLSKVIEEEKARTDQTEEVLLKISDLEETKQEILNKITEVGETKAEEVARVKAELAKMYGSAVAAESADGAGSSSSSTAAAAPEPTSSKSPEVAKPKPTDISHLIKRKKADNEAVHESPAKKMAVETPTGEMIAVDVVAEPKIEEVSDTVQVVDN